MTEVQRPFQEALAARLRHAERSDGSFVEIEAGELHRDVGGYPGPDHRMPVCCLVMTREMRTGDRVVSSPPKGKRASLTIRYRLPRP